jgi:hypothetical protein
MNSKQLGAALRRCSQVPLAYCSTSLFFPSCLIVSKMVGLMTQLGTLFGSVRLKSSVQTFFGTRFVPQKTCAMTVVLGTPYEIA